MYVYPRMNPDLRPSCIALLMEKEPANLQAQSLGQLIDKKAATGEFSSTALALTMR
jgi:hypothetical protein